ncbi:MAG: isoprenylcysteine carboxylmethyltransferase family protein [Clostridia bacterium]|nr:isoprenylcysteine carboxylmethyltransferase family protein [Clostridia bacterium]
MHTGLFTKALIRYLFGVLIVGILIFLPAGTFAFWQGWLLMGILFVPMFIAGCVMIKRDPGLLERRLNAREEQGAQKLVVLSSALMFVLSFVAAGLNFRFRWLLLPPWVSWLSALLFLSGYGLYAEVLRENTWLSRTVEVSKNQKLIDTGLYGLVRHPMYLSTLLLFLSMPLVLASPVSFAIMLFYIPIICARILNEERVLKTQLTGYEDYMRKVKYRLLPFIW